MSGFYQALPFVLRMEGGYANHPNDPGGATNYGITQATYNAWRRGRGQDTQPVRDIQSGEVESIYHREYWVAAHCDALSWPLSAVHFDAAVNHGVRRAVKLLQEALEVTVDGIWGPITERAARTRDRTDVIDAYLWARLDFYYRITARRSKYRTFLLGWLRRVLKLRKFAQDNW